MSNNYLNLLKDKEINNENTGWLLRLCHSNEGNKIKVGRMLSNENGQELLKKICSIRKEDIRKTVNFGFCEIIFTLVNSGMSASALYLLLIQL